MLLALGNLKGAIEERVYGMQPKEVPPDVHRDVVTTAEPLAHTEERPTLSTNVLDCVPLLTHEGQFFDPQSGRNVVLKGINVDSAMKLPTRPAMMSHQGNAADCNDIFFEGDTVSFVGRPFPLEDAEEHFRRIKSWGYNTVRYLLTWEALEHGGPGKYDEEFIDYTIEVLRRLHRVGGLYVFLELHQDVWSRYSGGSGAPMWTLYAAGLQPRRFAVTEAAISHNEARFQDEASPEIYPKMLWTSNYKRLASMVMFTFFFSGANYFPQCTINGVNVEQYLQNHYYGVIEHVWRRVNEALPDMIKDGTMLGFELMNEPNSGLVGHPHLDKLPDDQQLRVGTTPTVFQALKLGMGLPCEVDSYRISIAGPQKSSVKLIDPEGKRAWLSPEERSHLDKHYGWNRNPEWKAGECIFAQSKIWSYDRLDFDKLRSMSVEDRLLISNKECELLEPHFFHQVHRITPRPSTPVNHITKDYFINHQFVDFYVRHKKVIRSITPDAFVFIQPPVLEIPPRLKDDDRGIIDQKTVYCPHYYDGLSLMFKTWNTKYNVCTLGIMRDRYINPIFGMVFGEKAIRNCLKKQFFDIRKECEHNLGHIPVLMSETGMPFDMDDKKAYKDCRYTSQTKALDALSFALESLNMSHTFWCYNSLNSHKWGDGWNEEDFSFWSPEDRNLDVESMSGGPTRKRLLIKKLKAQIKSVPSEPIGSASGANGSGPSAGHNGSVGSRSGSGDDSNESKDNLLIDEHSIGAASTIVSHKNSVTSKSSKKYHPSPDGVRAVNAVIRPFVVATRGTVLDTFFDLKRVTFKVHLQLDKSHHHKNVDVGDRAAPTIVFVPKWHFPNLTANDVQVSSGHVKYNEQLEYIEWYHDGQREIEIPFLHHKETLIIKSNCDIFDKDDDESVFPCGDVKCPVT